MEEQKNRVLGSLYYDNTPPAYVAPPMKERKELMAIKEENYLVAKDTMNALDKVRQSIPKNLSPDIYNRVIGKLDSAMGEINADNMGEKLLDTKQIGQDLFNKWGAKELLDEQQQVEAVSSHFNAALEKGDIKDPDFANYKKAKSLENRQPLTVNLDGTISKPNIQPVNYAKYVDLTGKYDKLVNGWAADKWITKNPNGTITINRTIPGYFGLTEGAEVSAEEIFKAVQQNMSTDPEVSAFLNDQAEYKSANIPANAETVNQLLSPNVKKQLFGNENATIEDVQAAIDNGSLNPQAVIREAYKANDIINYASFPAYKYGATEEKMTTLKDDILLGALKEESDRRKAAANAPVDTAVVTVQPFIAQQELNPKDVTVIKEVKQKLSIDRANLQEEIFNYQRGINEKQEGFDKEELARMNARQTSLDEQISEISRQEKDLSTTLLREASAAGVDLKKTYKDALPESKEKVKFVNELALRATPFNIDVTSLVSNKNGNVQIKFKDGTTHNIEDTEDIVKQGDKYIYTKSGSYPMTGETWRGIQHLAYNSNGEINKAYVSGMDAKGQELSVTLPTEEEFLNLAVEAYNNDDNNTSMGIRKPYYNKNGKVLSSAIFSDLEKVRKEKGDFAWSVTTPLEYMLVKGDTSKSDLKVFNNKEAANKDAFRENPEQYSVKTIDGTMMLADYLKETYGIPDMSDLYIDRAKSNIHTLTDTDRNYGQKYGMSIVLTKAGIDEAKSGTFDANSTIKLVGVNLNKNVKAEQDDIRDTLLRTYANVNVGRGSHDSNIALQMGKMYLNNSPDGQALDALNLYTVPAGESKEFKLRGQDFTAHTTAKGSNRNDINNLNFHISKVANGKNYFLAIDNSDPTKPVKGWYSKEDVDKLDTLQKVAYDTPDDLKAALGATLLDGDYKAKKQSAANSGNAYSEYMQTSNYQVSSDGNKVTSTDYTKDFNFIKRNYNKTETVTLVNNVTNKPVTFSANFAESDMYDLTTKFSDRIANTVEYPYINKSIAPNVENLLGQENVTITGGARGKDTHVGLPDSAEGSLHKSGFGLDIRTDSDGLAFYDRVVNNQSLLDQYGIIKIMKHGTTPHIHIEFKPNRI